MSQWFFFRKKKKGNKTQDNAWKDNTKTGEGAVDVK